MKNSIGKPCEGKLQARFDEGGADSLMNFTNLVRNLTELSGSTLLEHLRMKKSGIYIVVIVILMFTFFFVIIPYWKYQHEGNSSIDSSELVEIQSKVQTVRKTTTGGKHPKPIIYVTLKDYSPTFRIANSSYRAIDDDEVLTRLKKGVIVSILTRQSEIDNSNSQSISDKVLNEFIKWRKQPLIYGLATEGSTLLNVEQYNEQQKDFNADNIKWGIILVLLVAGRLLWAAYEDKKQERTTT